MKQNEITVGKVYEVLVSGQRVAFEVRRRFEKSVYTFKRTPGGGEYKTFVFFEGVNLATGRVLTMKASRLRRLHPAHNATPDVVASEESLAAQGGRVGGYRS